MIRQFGGTRPGYRRSVKDSLQRSAFRDAGCAACIAQALISSEAL